MKQESKKDSKQESRKSVAVYPGSFDPITLGHIDIIKRISKLYDSVIILIAKSPDKPGLYSVDERKELILKSLPGIKNIQVDSHEGLTVDYLQSIGAKLIVRGLRAVVDFEYELSMANINKKLAPDIETILVFSAPEYYFISSRAVKEVAQHGGDLEGLVPSPVKDSLQKKMKNLLKVKK